MSPRPFRTAWLLVGLLACVLPCAAAAPEITLVRDGQPAATLVLAEYPTRAAQMGAFELQHHVKLITGATLPLVREPAPVSGTRILVGESRATHRLGLRPDQFGEQEYLIQFRPGALVLLGRDKPDYGEVVYDLDNLPACKGFPGTFDERGSLDAVYDFLRRYCGVRWLNPTELGLTCPQSSTLSVRGADLQRKPFFRYRDMLFNMGQQAGLYDSGVALWQRGTPEYLAWERTAYPGLYERYANASQRNLARTALAELFLRRMHNGGAAVLTNHSFYGYYTRFLEATWQDRLARAKSDQERAAVLANRARYFEGDHPEYFAQGYEGQPPQLCYTNPATVRQVVQDARDYYDDKRTGKQLQIFWEPVLPNPFPLQPMDNASFCKCPTCRAIYGEPPAGGREHFQNGRYSDYVFHFINKVARELHQTHPGAPLVAAAYGCYGQRPSFPLDPAVTIEFTFVSSGAPYDQKEYPHEEQLLKEWALAERQRPIYLQLFGGMNKEFAHKGRYHAFPGFYGHALGRQFQLFHQLGLKGMGYLGVGHEVEAYLAFRLMDDPTLDVDQLLNDYFTGLYGPAAAPMRQLYLEIEQTFCDPQLRPQVRVSGAELAWNRLGTEKRLARWQRLLDQAQALAQTELQKQRLAAWELGTWNYMTAGRAKYLDRASAPIPSLTVPRVEAAGGDPAQVAWDQAASLGDAWYQRGTADPAQRVLGGRIAHDGQFLYLELTDKCDTSKLQAAPLVFAYDDWEVFMAQQRSLPYRQYASGPTGLKVAVSHGEVNFRMNVIMDDTGFEVVSDTSASDLWVTRMVLPLATILPGGVAPGDTMYMNPIRVTSPTASSTGAEAVDTWVSHCFVHEVDRLGELKLAR
ncbi:MAG: DUF4838 domain-containing protein [candidate division WS1 bacterium]|nr:DUF4838 domain-containing protein [candidate division WS1 bacterium]